MGSAPLPASQLLLDIVQTLPGEASLQVTFFDPFCCEIVAPGMGVAPAWSLAIVIVALPKALRLTLSSANRH